MYQQAASAAQESELLSAGQEIKAETMVQEANQESVTTDELQADTDNLIAQAKQVLPMPEEENDLQVEDQAELDA